MGLDQSSGLFCGADAALESPSYRIPHVGPNAGESQPPNRSRYSKAKSWSRLQYLLSLTLSGETVKTELSTTTRLVCVPRAIEQSGPAAYGKTSSSVQMAG
jgi:hypothetical protein